MRFSSIQATIVVADDTDILALLIFHCKNITHSVFFKPEAKNNCKRIPRSWNIYLRTMLGADISENILSMHAILGCDTTSGVHGLGKKVAVTKMKTSKIVQKQAEVFLKSDVGTDDVIKAGETALVCLYNGNNDQGICDLRYQKFCIKTALSSAPVQAASLPPTSAAAKYHSLRAYMQVQRWKDSENQLIPENWGWLIKENKCIPVMSDLQPAPEKILKVIRCTCKTGCSSLRCTCRKHGLRCSIVCSDCKGVCSNMMDVTETDSDSSSEDESFI